MARLPTPVSALPNLVVTFPPLDPGAAASVMLTDGIGDQDDTVTIQLEGDFNYLTSAIPDMLAVSLDGVLFGPYDVERVAPEADGGIAMFGRKDRLFEEHFIDAAANLSIEIAKVTGVAPFASFPATITGIAWSWQSQILGQLAGASDLGGVRGVLSANGLHISPRVVMFIRSAPAGVTIPAAYRPASGRYVQTIHDFRLDPLFVTRRSDTTTHQTAITDSQGWLLSKLNVEGDRLHAIPSGSLDRDLGLDVVIPDIYNAPGSYKDRRIEVGELRKAGTGSTLVTITADGEVYPAIRLAPQMDVIAPEIAIDLERWRLQNSAADSEAVIDLDVTIQPHSLLTGLSSVYGSTAVWWVESVTHTFNAGQEGQTKAMLHLWQGGPFFLATSDDLDSEG